MMKKLFTQLRNEWRGNFFLALELLVVFVVLWYIVDWCCVTARVYFAPMGFDTRHCYCLMVNRLTPNSALYTPGRTVGDDMDDLLEIAERLRHRPGVEAVVDVDRLPFDASRFVLALLLSWLLMALMIVVGVCYPARRAMQVQPAEALHDE